MSKITIQKSAPTKFPFLSYLLVAFGLFLVQMGYGQASLTQFTNDDFNKGYSNHLVVKNNHVETPYKATSMGSWTSTEALPKALQNHQAVYWNNLTFVTGGIEVVGFQEGVEVREFSNTVYSATVNNGLTNWNELNDLPDSISEHASVVANGYLYVIGGIASDSAASDVVYYAKIRADGTIRDWQTNATALPVAMWGHTATFVDGYIVLTGGSHTADTSATSNVYTVLVEPTGELSNFTAQTSLNINRNQHAAVAYGNRIYVMGGFDETGALSSSVVYADMSISGGITSWTAGTSLPEALYGIAASAHNGTMIVSGGYNDNAGYSVQYSYSADLTAGSAFTWQKSGLYFEHIANASSISIDGKLYVMGGLDIFNNTRSETYYNNLNLSATAKIPNGSFLGEVFDLGLDRSVDTLHYAGDSLYNYAFYYRTAADGASWSSSVALVLGMNLIAILLRSHLRKKLT